jgi:large subunit ribosomal protein L20
MVRARYSVPRKKRKKKIMKLASGYRGVRSREYKRAKEQIMHSLAYSYMHRKEKKRDFRRLWIKRINNGLTNYDISYSRFIYGLKLANIELNRKVISNMIIENHEEFEKIVNRVKEVLAKN